MWQRLRYLFCFGLLASTGASADALNIDIRKGLSELPVQAIRLEDFSGEALSGRENIGQVVRHHLVRSGLFRQDDSAPLVVRGRTSVQGQRITYDYALMRGSETLLTRQFVTHASRWRDAAHFIADAVYRELTTLPGIFSTRLAFVYVYRRGNATRHRLEIADVDGARRTTLLDSDQPILSPTWSPDGRRLAYVSFESRQPQIVVHHLVQPKRQAVTAFAGTNAAPAWSPDGQQLAMSLTKDGNPELYVMNVETQQLTRLTRHPSIDTEPRWTPDGRSLLFTSDRSGTPQIYRLTLGNDEPRRLSFQGVLNARADVSPDGRYAAWVHHSGDGRYRIGVQNLERPNFDLMDQRNADTPSFAPDSRLVVYASKEGGRSVLRVSALDGRGGWVLPVPQGDLRAPAWSPTIRQ